MTTGKKRVMVNNNIWRMRIDEKLSPGTIEHESIIHVPTITRSHNVVIDRRLSVLGKSPFKISLQLGLETKKETPMCFSAFI